MKQPVKIFIEALWAAKCVYLSHINLAINLHSLQKINPHEHESTAHLTYSPTLL